MRKLINRILICLLAVTMFWTGGLLSDRRRLDQEVVRLHVVANSDDPVDQSIKLQVRDAVAESLCNAMAHAADPAAARAYLSDHLDQIQDAANAALQQLDAPYRAAVTFRKELFDTRSTDDLSLPAGIYQALRITIGDGAGQNWWGVLYPDFLNISDTEVPASMTDSLTGQDEIRFYCLDQLGRLQKYLAQKDFPSVFQPHSVVK